MNPLDRRGTAHNVDAGIARFRCRDHLIPVRRRQSGQATTQLIGAMATQLALVTLLELLFAAAALTVEEVYSGSEKLC